LRHVCNKYYRTGHLERQCDHIHKRRRRPKRNKVGLTQIGAARQAQTPNGMMIMKIFVNGFPAGLWIRYTKRPTPTSQFLKLRLLHKSSVCINNGKTTRYIITTT
jgi:hypothetical protein